MLRAPFYRGSVPFDPQGEAVVLELGSSRGDIFALRHPPAGQAYTGRYGVATPIADEQLRVRWRIVGKSGRIRRCMS